MNSVEDKLRIEYVNIYKALKDLKNRVEIKLTVLLKDELVREKTHEFLSIKSRIKTFDSAVLKLMKIERLEGRVFDDAKEYSLTKISDLVGIRVVAFLGSRASDFL